MANIHGVKVELSIAVLHCDSHADEEVFLSSRCFNIVGNAKDGFVKHLLYYPVSHRDM